MALCEQTVKAAPVFEDLMTWHEREIKHADTYMDITKKYQKYLSDLSLSQVEKNS